MYSLSQFEMPLSFHPKGEEKKENTVSQQILLKSHETIVGDLRDIKGVLLCLLQNYESVARTLDHIRRSLRGEFDYDMPIHVHDNESFVLDEEGKNDDYQYSGTDASTQVQGQVNDCVSEGMSSSSNWA